MPEQSFNVKMFASLTDATTKYNQVFDSYAEPALSDDNGNYMAALFDMHGVNQALWARDLSGASIDIIGFSQRTVSSSDGAYFGSSSSTVIDAQPIRQQLTFTATHAQWTENGVTVSAPYKNLGSVIEITENNNGMCSPPTTKLELPIF